VLTADAAEKYAGSAVSVGSGDKARRVIYGAVEETGEGYLVHPKSPGNPAEDGLTVAKDDVKGLEQGTVFTFHLRDGVKWHDGHALDADDVLFSWAVYSNPHVDCDNIRSYFQKVIDGEKVDPRTVRFFYDNQYFKALETVADMHLLPRHLYDLSDPDNPDHDPEATAEEQGEYINTNPHNREQYVGLGPYRLTAFTDQWVDAERNPDYFLPELAGYVDQIRWRYIPDDQTAFQALINGELDFFNRVKSEDYFGQGTADKAFTENFYKGYYYTGSFGYTGWNTRRPHLSDPEVRKALAMAFDVEEWRKTKYKGLAVQVTGPQNYFSAGYDHELKPLPYDLGLAEEKLAEAGWYDRDGDGVIDKDGVKMEIEFLYPSGNDASRDFGLKYQEQLAKIGVGMNLRQLEWATFLERVYERDFDAINLAWVQPVESDPEQLWHSSLAPKGVRSSNHPGVADPRVDALIAEGQRELDHDKRAAIWRELHRTLYDIQPYFYMFNSPRKFAMNKKVRGMETFMISPGYSIRRWYYPAGTPGTRPGPTR
jgi:peptide/nickel transport system substrate-binding protein